MNQKVKNMLYCSTFACIVSLLAQIKLDLPGIIPLTLQTLGIYLTGCTLKPKMAFIATMVYILMGSVGLPVFTGFRGGLSSLLGPTGGYIFSFPITSLIISLIINNKDTDFRKISAMMIGTIICYFIGTIWFVYITNNNIMAALAMCVFPFIPGDIIKMISALIISSKIKARL